LGGFSRIEYSKQKDEPLRHEGTKEFLRTKDEPQRNEVAKDFPKGKSRLNYYVKSQSKNVKDFFKIFKVFFKTANCHI